MTSRQELIMGEDWVKMVQEHGDRLATFVICWKTLGLGCSRLYVTVPPMAESLGYLLRMFSEVIQLQFLRSNKQKVGKEVA